MKDELILQRKNEAVMFLPFWQIAVSRTHNFAENLGDNKYINLLDDETRPNFAANSAAGKPRTCLRRVSKREN